MSKKKRKPSVIDDVSVLHPKGAESIDEEGQVAANGTCVVPTGFELTEVYGIVLPSDQSLPSDQEMYECDSTDGDEDEWSFPTLEGAQIGSNHSKFLCVLEATEVPASEKVTTQSFTGVEGTARKPRKKRQVSTRRRGVPQDPEGSQIFFGRWHLYRHLSVTDDHYGNRLMIGGNELRASRISIFVEDLLWRTEHSGSLIVVRKSSGNGVNANKDWRFPGVSQYSVCVHQARPAKTVVRSTNVFSPTKIRRLDPKRPIYINVNDRKRPSSANSYPDNSGAFNVWVRVDD